MRLPTVKSVRKELGCSQREMAERIGVSKKAVQSYEQGWRKAPPHVEQAVLLQAILRRNQDLRKVPYCWQFNACPPAVRGRCPSARLRRAGFCWLITGTLCQGAPTGSWTAKRTHCLMCKVLKLLLAPARRSRARAGSAAAVASARARSPALPVRLSRR